MTFSKFQQDIRRHYAIENKPANIYFFKVNVSIVGFQQVNVSRENISELQEKFELMPGRFETFSCLTLLYN